MRLAGLQERRGVPSLAGVLMSLWNIANDRAGGNDEETQRMLDAEGIGTTSAVREELRQAWL